MKLNQTKLAIPQKMQKQPFQRKAAKWKAFVVIYGI